MDRLLERAGQEQEWGVAGILERCFVVAGADPAQGGRGLRHSSLTVRHSLSSPVSFQKISDQPWPLCLWKMERHCRKLNGQRAIKSQGDMGTSSIEQGFTGMCPWCRRGSRRCRSPAQGARRSAARKTHKNLRPKRLIRRTHRRQLRSRCVSPLPHTRDLRPLGVRRAALQQAAVHVT